MGRGSNQLIASILVNAIYAMQGYPTWIVNNLLSPISIIILVTFISKGALIGEAIAGALITLFVGTGIMLQADLAHLKNDFKYQDMIVSSPTSAMTYMVGMALSNVIFIIPSLVVILVLAVIYIHASILAFVEVFMVLLLLYLFSVVLGFFLSTFTSDVMQSWSFTGILSLLMTTIAPVYYPITYIPLPYRYAFYLSPTTYAAEIIQNMLGYLPLSTMALALDWIVIIGLSIALFVVAIKKNKWREY